MIYTIGIWKTPEICCIAIVEEDSEAPMTAWTEEQFLFQVFSSPFIRPIAARVEGSVEPQLSNILYPTETSGSSSLLLLISSMANIIVCTKRNSLRLILKKRGIKKVFYIRGHEIKFQNKSTLYLEHLTGSGVSNAESEDTEVWL